MSRPKFRGVTLLEVLIASVIFMGLSLVLVACFQSARRMETKSDAQSDAYRRVQAVMAHLSSELRGAQIVEPVDPDISSTSLIYRKPEVVGERLKLAADGGPIWLDPSRVELNDSNKVWSIRPDASERFLADLGSEGELSFLRSRGDILSVTIEAAVVDPEDRVLREGRFRAERLFFFANQP